MLLGAIDPKEVEFEVENSLRGHWVEVETIKGQK